MNEAKPSQLLSHAKNKPLKSTIKQSMSVDTIDRKWGMKIALFLILCTTNCSSSLKKRCQLTDWKQMGISDGKKGNNTSGFTHKAKTCNEQGVIVNTILYYQGRNEGLTLYCTPLRGFAMGRANLKYKDICPPDERKREFLLGYILGKETYGNDNKKRATQIYNELLKLEKERFKKAMKTGGVMDYDRIPQMRRQMSKSQKKRELILKKLISLQNMKKQKNSKTY